MITINVRQSKNCNGDYSLFISFPFNEKIVNTLRALPTRYYDKDTKEWEVPIKTLKTLTNAFKSFDVTIYCPNLEMLSESKPEPLKQINFNFKTKPFVHQLEGFNFGLNHNRWLLGDEQGLGKTKQVIDIAVAKKELLGYKHCLIICGVNGLKWNWVNEVHTHSNEDAYILGQRTNKSGKVIIGSNKDKLADLNALKSNLSYFLITNVESLRDEKICAKISELCAQNAIQMIACDEIHKCLDYNSVITTDRGKMLLGDIVTNKLNVYVYSLNESTQQFEFKPVIDWHEKIVTNSMLTLTIQRDDNKIVTLTCTPDHKIYTRNRGWVEAQELTELDDITA